MSPFFWFSTRAFLLVYLGAITLPSVSRAQQGNMQCTSIDDPEFDFQAIVQEGFEIRWAMDTTADTITFEVFNSVQSWAAIGFSGEDGAMIGSDAVIGLPANVSVNEYNLTAKDVASIDLFDDQEITNAFVEQVMDGTTITFTRPFTPANSEKKTLSSTPGEVNSIIWAFGEDNELAYHGQNHNSFLLDLFCGETASSENMTATPTASPTSSEDMTAISTASPASSEDMTATPAASPTSSEDMTATPIASPTSAPSGPDVNRAGGVHGSFRPGSNGGGWWVTASTGLTVLLGATLVLSW